MDITPKRMFDGLANVFSRLGTMADRNTRSTYYVPPITQDIIEAAYRSSWLTRKVHDLVPFEMTRAGRNWKAEKDAITSLEKTERELQIWHKLRKALTVARLHGGAALVLGVRQGMPDQPLRMERLTRNSLQYAVVVSKHQLGAPMGFERDPVSEFFMQPQMYEMATPRGNPIRIHPSRVIPFHGMPLPEGALTVSQIEQFWGDPLLITLKSAIDNAETSQAAVATLLHEMKQDVISIPGLTKHLATQEGENLLTARLQGHEQFKSMFNALLLDGGDKDGKGGEEWETRQLSFANYPELLRQFVAIVAGAADIPVTRLMGESPGGLQSTGKGEQDDFNRMIAARQDADLLPGLQRLDEILIRSALGSRPDEITSEMAPLDELDAAQASEIEKREAESAQVYYNMGALPGSSLQKVVANRMLESGRWPGLAEALEEAENELAAEPGPEDDDEDDLPEPANENDVREAERRGTITRDDALLLLADGSPMPLYVRRDLVNGDELLAWARGVGFTDLVDAADLHATIIYSKAPVDWMKAGEDWTAHGDDGKHTVPAGGPRMVETFNDKAVVLQFASSHLSWRHESIRRETGASHGFDEYSPHVTFFYGDPDPDVLAAAKAQPFTGKLEFGPEIFEKIDEDWRASRSEA